MANKLLIDGENFVHGVVGILVRGKVIQSRADIKKIDLEVLLNGLIDYKKTRKIYYTTRIILPQKQSILYKKFESMRLWNKRFIPYLMNQKVELIKAGVLRSAKSKKCYSCGTVSELPQEKGVDVKLGVDIVSLAGKGNTIYVFSSDSDLIPAITEAKNRKADVVYISFEAGVNEALRKVCSKTVIVTKKNVINAYKEANK
jgi:uncharacterized LabA/DUF88 family protein